MVVDRHRHTHTYSQQQPPYVRKGGRGHTPKKHWPTFSPRERQPDELLLLRAHPRLGLQQHLRDMLMGGVRLSLRGFGSRVGNAWMDTT